MEKTPVVLFLLLLFSPLPIVAFRKMWLAMKCREEHARNNEWSAEYSAGMFALLMSGAFGVTISPYLIVGFFALCR